MDAIFDQVRSLANNADDAARKKILDGLRNLTYSIETPQDSIQRIIFYVGPEIPVMGSGLHSIELQACCCHHWHGLEAVHYPCRFIKAVDCRRAFREDWCSSTVAKLVYPL